jgi:parallel beta-helix repeat protein
MQVLNSSVVGNQATDDGGGIYLGNSDHLLANTTVSYNSADEGGGIYAYVGNTTLEHASVTNNRAVTGGGLKSVGSGKTVSSSLIADNGASSSGRDCSGSVTSGGYSLVTTTNSCAWTSATGDQLNVSAGLAGLSTGTSPGHPAMTISSSSNALDAGGLCATYPNDQLGQARVGVCDIGAWEY